MAIGLVVWSITCSNTVNETPISFDLAKTLVRQLCRLPAAVSRARAIWRKRAVPSMHHLIFIPASRRLSTAIEKRRRWRCWPYRGCSWWCST